MPSRWAQPDTYVNGLAAANRILAVVLFGALTVVVALQVFTRFVLHMPFIWSEEVARFLFFWVVLLGAALSVKTRRHFVIDVTMGRAGKLGRRGRFLFDIIPDLCIVGFSVFLLVQGIGYTHSGLFRTATNSDINMALVYGAIPVFAALSVVYTIANLLLDYAAFVRGQDATQRPPQSAE
jgi:TRAP-type C4-dicarboxylate transport system permease small subunit